MKSDPSKPNPDDLLKAITREELQAGRGRLRIFLGMCPGVGKTYSMLEAAKERQREGAKVLVGIVETHGRKETENLLQGLTTLPRKKIDYRGKLFDELDVEAVIEKRPDLVVVDELAHTNIPGSLHPKRYQDVAQILEAGIDVYTTVNIQHIESRIDLVKQITGVSIHETVPDSFFELADQVELVDLPPRELLKRLKEGKVYLAEMAERAADSFFKEEHLLALRELSLRFTAEVVDDELHDQMVKKQIAGPWQTKEKLLVAISHSPYSKRLIRAARRKAFTQEAAWIALYIDSGEPLSSEDKDTLKQNIDLALALGAELVTVRDSNVPGAIRRIAEEKNITQIIMGRPDRRPIRDLLRGGTLLDQLVRETSEIDVHVLRQPRRPRYKGIRFKIPSFPGSPVQYSNTVWFLVALTAAGSVLVPYIGYQAVGFLYLAGILLLASLAERGPVFFAAGVSALLWNYLFIPPRFTFYIRQPSDLMMCFAYFAVAVMGSLLTSKIRSQAKELRTRVQRTDLLYGFTREIAEAENIQSMVKVTARFVESTAEGYCAVMLRNEMGELLITHHTPSGQPINDKDLAVAFWVNTNGKKAGIGTGTLPGTDAYSLPLNGKRGIVGVLLFIPKDKQPLTIEQEALLESVAAASAIAFERLQLQETAKQIHIFEESEKLYETILDSVSHELRTPITAIIGASSALQDPKTALNTDGTRSLTEDVIRSALRLNDVVENLLDMSRLNSGRLALRREIAELSEVIEEAVAAWKRNQHPTQQIEITAEENIYVNLDARMFEHVLFNLLKNACMYSPPQSKIRVNVGKDLKEKVALIDIIDEGKEISAEMRETVFEKFFRGKESTAGGIGLGLSIVRGIVLAHGGTVSAFPRADGLGNRFQIRLPLWTKGFPQPAGNGVEDAQP